MTSLLITGASRSLGAETTLVYARAGEFVANGDPFSESPGKDVGRELRESAPRFH